MPEVWSALGRLHYESGELADSEKAYAKAVALKDDGRGWFNLGAVRMRLQDTAGALQAFTPAAQHVETKEQAEAEMKRLREANARDRIAPIDRARGTLEYIGPRR
jgi:cytochrome c-type biogenesis protein CcmH/NrfG